MQGKGDIRKEAGESGKLCLLVENLKNFWRCSVVGAENEN